MVSVGMVLGKKNWNGNGIWDAGEIAHLSVAQNLEAVFCRGGGGGCRGKDDGRRRRAGQTHVCKAGRVEGEWLTLELYS
jgi:hypothetical protein